MDVDAVGDLEDRGDVVADQDDRYAGAGDPLDQVEHALGLADAEGGGGLVHDDDLAAERGGAGDGDGLPLPAGEAVDRLGDRLQRGDAQLVHLRARLLAHLLGVDHPQDRAQRALALDLPAEEEVGGDVERRGHREVLVDGLDAGLLGVVRALEVHGLAVEQDLAGVGDDVTGEDLDQAGLAGPVVADDREHLPGAEVEVRAVDGGHVPVALDDVAGLQHGLGHRAFLRVMLSRATAAMTSTPVTMFWYSGSMPAWVRPDCRTRTISAPR